MLAPNSVSPAKPADTSSSSYDASFGLTVTISMKAVKRVRGMLPDGTIVVASSQEGEGHPHYFIVSRGGFLVHDKVREGDMTCPAFRRRGTCGHVEAAAGWMERRTPVGDGPARMWDRTRNDPHRLVARRRLTTRSYPLDDSYDVP